MIQTSVHNLIILDKSGSMSSIRNAAIAGVNETIGTIQAAERRNPDQKQYITLVAFCGCEQRYIFDHIPAAEARHITADDYQPCCSTPLYDTVGRACIGLENYLRGEKLASASVTIITDGYENASREFTHNTLVTMIGRLKECGWMFAYIGADHDVESVAFSLKIDNAMKFQKDEAGTRRMWNKFNACMSAFADSSHTAMNEEFDNMEPDEIDESKLKRMKKKLSENFFRK